MAFNWPADWHRVRLEQVADVKWGDTSVTKASYVPSGYIAYSASGPDGYLNYADFERTAVVLSAIGAQSGKTWLARGKWSCIKNTIRFWSISDAVDTEFLYWVTKRASLWPKRGSAQPFISLGDARKVEIAYPPLPAQRQISQLLGALDDKIELNRRMSETLEQIAQSIFHDWFVNFGPTRAKAAGRTPYLAQHLWQQFPNTLDSSGLPSGWERRTVGDFATIRGGKQLKRELIAPRGRVPVFGGAGLMGYTENHNADGFVITVGRVGAYCGQFFHHRGPAWINNNASLITPRSDVSPEWFLHLLRNLDLNPIKKGAAQPFISNGDLSRLDVVHPGPTLISAFHDATSNLIKRAEAATRESATLVEVRDTLLPKLISGELRIPQAEQLVSEVV